MYKVTFVPKTARKHFDEDMGREPLPFYSAHKVFLSKHHHLHGQARS